MTARVNGRAKGRAFEQSIARDLRAWLGDGWTVTRTPTDQQRDQAQRGQAGEFTVVGPGRFTWALECKAHKDFDLRQLWRRPIDGPLPGWWRQATGQAAKVGARPMLVVKVARGETLCIVPGTAHAAGPYFDFVLGDENLTAVRWADAAGLVRRGIALEPR